MQNKSHNWQNEGFKDNSESSMKFQIGVFKVSFLNFIRVSRLGARANRFNSKNSFQTPEMLNVLLVKRTWSSVLTLHHVLLG